LCKIITAIPIHAAFLPRAMATGLPDALCEAVVGQGARDLTVVANNAGTGRTGLAALLAAGRVRRIICSFPRSSGSVVFEELYAAGRIELELVPQGIISERMRCAAAGLGGFYSPVSVGTRLAEGKEHREIDGRMYVLEKPLKGDVALLSADRADRWGNLTYRKSAPDFIPADREIVLHSENGVLGVGPAPSDNEVDWDLINAGKQPITLVTGGSYAHHTDSFLMIRGGHLDLALLGAFEVSEKGDLANWTTDDPGFPPGVGGAMDLAVGAKEIRVLVEHTTKGGAPRIRRRCQYPLTAAAVVRRIYTDL